MTTDLKLIIYINQDIFSYTIFNTNKNCFEEINQYNLLRNQKNLSEEILKTIESNSILSKNYSKILCAVDFETSTFIPIELFNKNNINHYINDNNQENKIEYIKQQFIDCYTLFTIPKNILEILETKYNNIHIKPFASIIVDYAMHIHNKNDSQILTQVNKNNFHITFVNNGQFIFYNKFNFESTDDFLYYFMNCLHILEIDGKKTNTFVITELDNKLELFQKLSKYLQILFLEKPSNFLYKNQILEYETYKNHKLFSQLICE